MAGWNEIVNLVALEALEEAEMLADRPQRQHVIWNDRFENIGDNKFKKLYRLSKPMVSELIDLLEPHMEAPTRISGLSIPRKVLIALRFFASGSYQMDIGQNVNHNVSQGSVSKCIKEVTDALNTPNILNAFISMPRNIEELRNTRQKFFQRHQFPGVIGCIDCTHVAIFPPRIDDRLHPEAVYINRKGYHSINVQLICDSNLKIMNVCARFPGSTHDSFIWNHSLAFQYMQNLQANNHRSSYLLGDSGYALRPWMLTPINNAEPNTPEEAYNISHRSTRSLIEQCNGVLKLRFRCLLKHRVLHYVPSRCSKIINSCAILHMCIANNLPAVHFGDEEEDQFINIDYGLYDVENNRENPEFRNQINRDLIAGRRMQQLVIDNHFTL